MTLLSNEIDINEGELLIYGDIVDKAYDDGEISPSVVRDALEEMGSVKVLNMHINSYGGSVPDGNAIITILDDYRRKNGTTINAYIEGIAASMGSGIPMVADKIYMASNALLMVHKPYTLVMGNIDDLQKQIDILEKAEETLIINYMRHFKGSREELEDLMAKETWLTAEEALGYGLCDEIVKGVAIAASAKGYMINNQKFQNLPDKAVAKLMPMAKAEEPPIIISKGADKVNEKFAYDDDLKAFGITEDKFKELGVNAETALVIAKTSANTVLPKDKLAEVSGIVITNEQMISCLGGMETPETLLALAQAAYNIDEKMVDKAKSYDKLVETAIDNAVKSYVRAKGENADETRAKKMLNNFTYEEILEQQTEWDNEAEIVLKAGKRVSELQASIEKDQDVLIDTKPYEIFK